MSGPTELPYVGNELELFAHARNWKNYWSAAIRPYLRGDVLEVGAGIGANTRLLVSASPPIRRWVCLEPDARLLKELSAVRGKHGENVQNAMWNCVETRLGTVETLDPGDNFDLVLYIDVMEHIPDDRAEFSRAAAKLRPGGRLVVLSPAHPWLFSPFDASIGHCRRYTRRSLLEAAHGIASLRVERVAYLDSCGLLASASNRLLLKQSLPTLRQILVWDRCMVPISRVLDSILLHRLGKSVLAVWQRQP